MLREESFPCGRDFHRVYGDPGMPYTMHACWDGVPCMEWRFQIPERMHTARDEVVEVVKKERTSVRIHLRGPNGITSTTHSFTTVRKPLPLPVVWAVIGSITFVMALLM